MSVKRNRLNAGYELEPRVMLSGSVPGAEAPVASEVEAAPEAEAAPEVEAAPEAETELAAVAEDDGNVEETAVAEEEVVTEEEVVAEEEVAEEEVAEEEVVEEEVVAEEVVAEEVVAEEVVAEEVVEEEVVAEDVVAEEAATEEAPTEEVPAEETPTEEVPAEEAPTEQAPAEVAPAEELPAEEAPTEEIFAEEVEAPVADSSAVLPEGVDAVVNNPVDGSIVSDATAFEVGGEAEINNAGEIAGAVNGVDFTETGSGTLNNAATGTVSSDSRAVQINGDDVTVNNDGSIIGTDDQRNGTVYSNRTADDFEINNRGVIDAGKGNEGAGISTELVAEGTTFDVNNDGLIQGRGDAAAGAATAGDGIRLERTRVEGALDGTTTGLFDGTINNSGLIDSEGANGTVSGFRAVNGVDFQGELNNTGTISGDQNGVYFGNATPAGGGDNTGGVVNNKGTISSDSRAFNIDGTGLEVNNDGQIIGTDDQRNGTVYADSTAQDFTLNNRGLIDAGEETEGAGFSVELAEEGNTFEINNDGLIQGRGDAAAGTTAAGDGIRLERTRVEGALDGTTTGLFDGTINNSGLVASEGANGTVGGFRAVNGVDFQGELNNTGTISGEQNGVYFGTGDHTDGVVNNKGSITSDSRAVNIDGTGLEFNNSGQVEATDRQRNGTVYVDGTADEFAINNTGRIDARTGAGSGVSIEVGAEAGDTQTGSLTNSGEIFGSGDLAEDAGIRLSAGAEGEVDFEGDIVNSGLISAETENAVLVEDGVNFEGDLINSGTIDGGIELSSGDVVLTEESVVYLDVDSDYAVEQIDTEGNVTLGGTLNVRFEEGFVPEVGQTFDFVDAGATSGSFDSVQAEGIEFDTTNLGVDGTVVVLSNGQTAVIEDGQAVVVAEAGDPAAPVADAVVSDAGVVEAIDADAGVAEVAEADAEPTREEARAERDASRDAERADRRAAQDAARAERDLGRSERREGRDQERSSRRDQRDQAREARRSSRDSLADRSQELYV